MDVHALGEYGGQRTLRGLTRPVSRLVQEFRSRCLVPNDVPDLLVTEFDPHATAFGWACGFSVPAEVLPLIPTE